MMSPSPRGHASVLMGLRPHSVFAGEPSCIISIMFMKERMALISRNQTKTLSGIPGSPGHCFDETNERTTELFVRIFTNASAIRNACGWNANADNGTDLRSASVAPAKNSEIGTPKAFAIWCSRLAPTRLRPFSYF